MKIEEIRARVLTRENRARRREKARALAEELEELTKRATAAGLEEEKDWGVDSRQELLEIYEAIVEEVAEGAYPWPESGALPEKAKEALRAREVLA